MLNYNDLSSGKKKWVHLIELIHPEVSDRITYDQITKYDAELRALRAKDSKYKVSMPLWLIGENVISRGVYFFPSDRFTYEDTLVQSAADVELDSLYQKTLEAYEIY